MKTAVCLFVLGVCAASILTAQSEEREPLKALVEAAGDNVKENRPFTITILVNYPNPEEIMVDPPNFQEDFTLERLRTSAHIMGGRRAAQINNTVNESSKWTEIEMLLIPAKAGTFTIGSFVISSPDDTTITLPLQFVVLPDSKELAAPRFVWRGAQNIRAGETGDAVLRITGWPAEWAYPGDLPLNIQAPKNALLEPLPLTKSDRTNGIVLSLRIHPFDGKEVVLEGGRFFYKDWQLFVPEFRAKVLPAIQTAAQKNEAPDAALPAEEPPDGAGSSETKPAVPPFPLEEPFSGGLLVRIDGVQLQKTIDEARDFWNAGDYAASLALLRAGERDFLAGAQVAKLRKDAETALGLKLMNNEIWQPAQFFVIAGLLCCVYLLFLGGSTFYDRHKTKRKAALALTPVKTRPLPVKRALAAAGILVLCLCASLNWKLSRRENAVLRTSPAYNVPEFIGNSGLLFSEGTPVRIKTSTGAWVYAVAENGSSGWVPADKTVFY